MSTTGKQLMKDFKFSNFKKNSVMFARVLTSPFPIYIVFFDSSRPNIAMTSQRATKHPLVTEVFRGLNETQLSPLLPLEDYNGPINNRLFILSDQAGNRLATTKYRENKSIINDNISFFYEATGFTLRDLQLRGVSPITRTSSRERSSEGSTGSVLKDVLWNKKKDSITLTYHVVPTYDKKVPVYSSSSEGAISKKNSNHYTIKVQFEEVSDFLLTKDKKEFGELTKGEQTEFFNYLINNATAKISSNDASWIFQGAFENASELNYSIYPYKGPKGKGEWSRRHMGEDPAIYITKHQLEVFRQIKKDSAKISKIIRDKYL